MEADLNLANILWTVFVQYIAPLLVGGAAVAPVVEFLKKLFGFKDKNIVLGELVLPVAQVVAYIVALVEAVLYHIAFFDEPLTDASLVALLAAAITSAQVWYKISYKPLKRIAGTE